ncbi:hypothetical protein CAI21_07305 [Alkalilimnicola ehrlichii]|uniref:Uncharacterized protein n=1 Tax=Alkalilimnicola ehrlichii TaxID=351052 RepID=A0A3E0WWK9_9GAMM|nr:hypothetical protein [Alkalilimnicola ehrlichii]RFA30017.1 hypothetical protein CAI21_07305 [Alkalilimnicola ehrlichii]RFA37362.1 hypothetical protein CAL65_08640 [Alkalilimnicola ehrlichii]
MRWNYRIVRKQGVLAVFEVYYDEDGKPETCTADPVAPQGETLDELRGDLEHYVAALASPILDIEQFRNQW